MLFVAGALTVVASAYAQLVLGWVLGRRMWLWAGLSVGAWAASLPVIGAPAPQRLQWAVALAGVLAAAPWLTIRSGTERMMTAGAMPLLVVALVVAEAALPLYALAVAAVLGRTARTLWTGDDGARAAARRTGWLALLIAVSGIGLASVLHHRDTFESARAAAWCVASAGAALACAIAAAATCLVATRRALYVSDVRVEGRIAGALALGWTAGVAVLVVSAVRG